MPTGYYRAPQNLTAQPATVPNNPDYFRRYGLNYDPNYQPITGYQQSNYQDAVNGGNSPAMAEAAARGQGIPQYAQASAPNVEDQANLRRRESQGNGAGLFAAGMAGMLGAGGLMSLGGGAGAGAGVGAGGGASAGTAGAVGGAGAASGAGAAGTAGAVSGIPAGMEGVTVVGSSGGGAGGLVGAGAGAGAGAAAGESSSSSGNKDSFWKRLLRQQQPGGGGQQQQQQSSGPRIWTDPANDYVLSKDQRKQRLLALAIKQYTGQVA